VTRFAGYRVKVRFPDNKSAFYVREHSGYFLPEWYLSPSHSVVTLTTDRDRAAIWPRESKALTVAACVVAERERKCGDCTVRVVPVYLVEKSMNWERVIR
jgi:hypothetical protein